MSRAYRFEQERGFEGADRTAPRDGPVQFQREEDPFGLSGFLKDVRHGGTGASTASANSSSKRNNTDDREERNGEKRRRK